MIKYFFIALMMCVLSTFSGNCQAKNHNKLNSCELAKNVNANYNIIMKDSFQMILKKGNDKCNLLLVDTIIKNFIKLRNLHSYQILGRLANYTDGYLSEYLSEKIGLIFKNSFRSFFNFLYNDSIKTNKNALEKFMIEYWSSKISLSDEPQVELQKIKNKCILEVKSLKGATSEHFNYLNNLLQKINPSYLD